MLIDLAHTNVRRPVRPAWQTVLRMPSLDVDEVHVWLLRVDEGLRVGLEAALSQTEMNRAAALKFRSHQTQFVVARGALRSLLAKYLGQAAKDIEILCAELGKPYLSSRYSPCVKFNVSHSDRYAVFGFSVGQELGIDIERKDTNVIDEGLLRQCLTPPERSRFERVLSTTRTNLFFDTWARKEAYMKLLGDGLNIPPTELSLAPTGLSRETVDGYEVFFTQMPVIDQFSSALATRKKPAKVRFYTPSSNLLLM